MNGAFYIGSVGLQSQQHALDVVANNVANLNTPGFKRSEVRFYDLVAAPEAQDDAVGGDGLAALGGVRAADAEQVFDQGELRQTGKAMDLAIDGEGFIELVGPAGQDLLWRGGTLKVNSDGFLAAANGMPLKAMISVPEATQSLSIDASGRVTAVVAGETAQPEIGRIELARMKDLSQLQSLGEGLYAAQAPDDLVVAAAGEEGLGRLAQGSLEASNVELSQEMITLLLMQRAYAANAQVVQAGDQLMAIANGLRR